MNIQGYDGIMTGISNKEHNSVMCWYVLSLYCYLFIAVSEVICVNVMFTHRYAHIVDPIS